MKPIIEDLKIEKITKAYLSELLESGICKRIYIVTGEKTIFKSDPFIEGFKKAIKTYPSLKVEVIAHLEDQEIKEIRKRIGPIQKNLWVYNASKRQEVHFALIETQDNKTLLHLQRKHPPGQPTDEWLVKNPFYLKWKYLLKFKFCRKFSVLTLRGGK